MRRLDRAFDRLASRGRRSDPNEVIDRLERRLAGEPQVVRIPGRPDMDNTEARSTGRRGLLAAAAAMAVALLVAVPLIIFLLGGDQPSPVTPPPSPTDLSWGRVPHDDGIFGGEGAQAMFLVETGGPGLVAMSGGTVWTSPDGYAWTRLPFDEAAFGDPGDFVRAFATGGPGLVAVGRHDTDPMTLPHPVVWVSNDGLDWTRLDDTADFVAPGGRDILAVATDGQTLVAVGVDCAGEDWDTADCDAAVWTSPDGYTWARVPHDENVFGGPHDQDMFAVTAGGPGFVAVGLDHVWGDDAAAMAVWVSPDGHDWTRVPHDDAVFGDASLLTAAQDVVTGGPGLVAVGHETAALGGLGKHEGVVWASADGFTWTRVEDQPGFSGNGDQGIHTVAAFGSGLVAAGWDTSTPDPDAVLWGSADGYDWTRLTLDATALGRGEQHRIRDLVAFGSRMIAVGNDVTDPDSNDGLGELDAAVWVGEVTTGTATTTSTTAAATTADPSRRWDLDALAAHQAGTLSPAATCPAGSAPDTPGDTDDPHPPAADFATAAFDRQSGVVVVGVGTETWAFDPCRNRWQLMSTGGPEMGDTAYEALVYDADSDLTVAFDGSGVWTYDFDTNTWDRLGWELPTVRGQGLYHAPSGLIVAVGQSDVVWAYDVETETRFELGSMPARGLLAYAPGRDEFYLYEVYQRHPGGSTWRYDGDSGWVVLGIPTPTLEFAFGDLFNGREITVDETSDRVIIHSGAAVAVLDPTVQGWETPYLHEVREAAAADGPGFGWPASVLWDPLNDRLLVFGGRRDPGEGDWVTVASVWGFDFGTGQWLELAPADV